MRKLLITLLLASAAAAPAVAGPRNWSDRQQAQSDRQQAREERQQAREERQQVREERSAERPAFVPQQRQPMVHQQQFARPDRGQQRQVDVEAMRAQREAYVTQRQQDIRAARDLRQSNRPAPNVMRDRHPLIVSDTPQPGTQPPMRGDSHVRWDTSWRNNGHYDWRRYRDHHRSRFHLGLYYDPFGWGYYPFSIGYRMWPAYYGNQFWIDPMMYGLPYAPPGAAWVRYWNDAVLVDIYTGTVLDVIPGFFW